MTTPLTFKMLAKKESLDSALPVKNLILPKDSGFRHMQYGGFGGRFKIM